MRKILWLSYEEIRPNKSVDNKDKLVFAVRNLNFGLRVFFYNIKVMNYKVNLTVTYFLDEII